MLILIAIIVLFLTWAPIDNLILSLIKNDWFCGLISGFAGKFIGANGPFVIACLRTKKLSPEILVANYGAIMLAHHSINIILFIHFFQFPIEEYFFFIIVLAVTGYAGEYLRRNLISKISFKSINFFKNTFNIIIFVLNSIMRTSIILEKHKALFQ